MWHKIERFFHWLTFNNWGFPWHILLCFIAVGYGKLLWAPQYVAPAVLAIALIYEVWEYRRIKRDLPQGYNPSEDMLQDIVANLTGIILGLFI